MRMGSNTVIIFTTLLCLLHAIASISAHSVDREGYITIDCGNDESFSKSGIDYTSDSAYIDTGMNHKPSSEFLIDQPNETYNTLRSFPVGKRNCYNLKTSNAKGNTYLIRAEFMYGNYDGSNNIPTFDVYIGVNIWKTVTLRDASYKLFIEIIHHSKESYVSICLVNINQGIPFISALYLRPLDNSIYAHQSGSLYTFDRYNTGSINTANTSRYRSYPDDQYDRLWTGLPLSFSNHWETYNSSTNVTTSIINDAYKLPTSIFNAGAQPLNGERLLGFVPHSQDYSPATFYVYWHFAETQKLGPNDLREFRILINNFEVGTYRPKYLHSQTIYSSPINVALQEPPFTFYIEQTNASTLPPILNAVELYKVVSLSQSATNQADVDAIMDIKTKYGSINGWQGDPCLPVSPWDGLNCSNNDNSPPSITSMNLSSRGLTGELLPSISSLSSLSYLNLSNNKLTGKIPEFLANMPSLQVIDLKGNKFHGSVPIKLLERAQSGSLWLSVDEGPDLCSSIECAKKNMKYKIMAAVVASFLLVVLLAVVLYYAYRWKTKQGVPRGFKRKGVIKSKGRQFGYSEIITMTKNFETIIGKGGCGTVYYGTLEDGSSAAIKILNPSSLHFGVQSFQTEAELLTTVHHRNLVSLVGYCDDGDTMALVYEYMVNGNLQEQLSGERDKILSWTERLQISIDAAQGLEYLHRGCKLAIVHRDLKPANILLDDKFKARIADFGLSRIFKSDSATHISTEQVAGTPGYLDPEYFVANRLSEKSDIYSFGVILLELITGQMAIMKTDYSYVTHIKEWVTPFYERGEIHEIVDKKLQRNFDTNSAWKALETAMSCIPPSGIQRPSIDHVLDELKQCLAIELNSKRSNQLRQQNTSSSQTIDGITFVDSEVNKGPSAR